MGTRDQDGRPESGQDPLAFLAGGGEMGERTRAFDWSGTPLGPVGGWPQSLRSALGICLNSNFPIAVYWGRDLVLLYNDSWSPILGEKHPWALGRPAREAWSEIWEIIGPLFDQVMTTGEATRRRDQLLPMRRHGFTEECYFDYTFSPVRDERGRVEGVFNAVIETTNRVIGERRLWTLRELSAWETGEVRSAEDACQTAARTLAENPYDLPFALLFLLDDGGRQVRLAGQAGFGPGARAAAFDLEDLKAPWPVRQVAETGKAVEVGDLSERFGPPAGGAWPEPPRRAVVLPMTKPGQTHLAGFVVAGVSPRLALSDEYRAFLDLLAGHVAAAVANARAYEEERRRAEALAELDRAKTAFFSNVSHEFRTPLTLMLGPVEDLLARSHTDLSPAAAGQLEVVNRNGLRLLRLVNSLLDFSRIEAGRVRAVYQPTDLAAFTAELASVFRSACERAGLRLVVDCPKLAEPVYVDRDMWEKVVLNLLSNAFKFTFEGEIAVSLRQVGGNAELRVRDTGTGVPADEMPRLFERFHRVENARGRTHEGSGIGLALVQELVKLHGGSVAAESVVGRGTTFTVALPFGSAHLPPDKIGDGRSPASTMSGAMPYVEEALRWLPDEKQGESGGPELPTYQEVLPVPASACGPEGEDARPRVLVADDNADMRQYVTRLLAEQYHVRAAPDGEAALAAARERPPDLVLTDVMMPRLDGFGLLRELRADPRTRDVPVIMLSARAGEESRVEGMEAGADDYLVKPFSARELLARVTAHLQMARMRREANESLRAQEEGLREAQRVAHVGSWQWDPKADVSTGSDELFRIYGLDPAQGFPKFQDQDGVLYSHESWRQINEAVRQTLQSGVGYELDVPALRNGAPIWITIRSEVVRDARGEVVGLRGTVQDVTDRKRAEEALKEADRRKDEFLATLAHELRNPLAPIRNGLQVMKLARGDAEAVEQARAMMERQLAQMVRLIDDLLDVSRISRGKVTLQKGRVELAKVVQQAVETSRPAIEAAGHDLTIDAPPQPVFVDADATRMVQVFSNLLNNAAKFTERGGRITLFVEQRGGDAVVRVKDTGVGIAAPMLPTVFEMFTQVDRSLEKTQGGLGIGLSLVKGLVELHGGSVEARSEGHGRGSEFVVRLPVWRDEDGRTKEESGNSSFILPPTTLKVLVADDNEDAAASLAMMLQLRGHEVRTAGDGLRAVDAAAAFRPDVVLLDIGMPHLNGYEACRRIRGLPGGEKAVLIALTGWGQEEDRRRSREAGFDHHLVKPVEPAVLEKLLAGLRPAAGG